jgi:hypothetical protein
MIRFGVEISARVSGFSINFCGQCRSFPDETETERDPVSGTLCSLVCRILGDGQSPTIQ